jgi:hypothetical protein
MEFPSMFWCDLGAAFATAGGKVLRADAWVKFLQQCPAGTSVPRCYIGRPVALPSRFAANAGNDRDITTSANSSSPLNL